MCVNEAAWCVDDAESQLARVQHGALIVPSFYRTHTQMLCSHEIVESSLTGSMIDLCPCFICLFCLPHALPSLTTPLHN